MKKNKTFKSLGYLIAMVFIVYTCYKKTSIPKSVENQVSTKKGIETITTLEKKDIVEVERKIDEINKRKGSDFRDIFKNDVIMGDSISESLVEYGILDKSSVVAVKGRNTITAMKDVNIVKNLSPQNIIMSYGMNDISVFGGKSDNFIKSYKKLIDDLRQDLPSAKISVCSILPVKDKVIEKESEYKNLDKFNQAIETMCKELKITYIETTNLLIENSSLYEEDGMHVKKDFYDIWLKKIEEEI